MFFMRQFLDVQYVLVGAAVDSRAGSALAESANNPGHPLAGGLPRPVKMHKTNSFTHNRALQVDREHSMPISGLLHNCW
jgi:hypothetical protein